MKKTIFALLSTTLFSLNLLAQSDTAVVYNNVPEFTNSTIDKEVYKINYKWEVPVTLTLDAYSLWGMSQIYGRDEVPQAEILALDYKKINNFDRSVWDNYDPKARAASDKFFYGSMPMPLFLMLDKEIRKDWYKIATLYLQAMGSTGVMYTSSAMLADRFRPYTYNPAVPMDYRTRGGARNSFMAGHPALVATSAFFCAKVFSDYHPEFKQKWVLYTVAGGAAAATGLLRIKAGEHFRTDVLTGVTVGTLSGILIPHLHKVKYGKMQKLSIYPNYQNNQTGFTAFYKLGK